MSISVDRVMREIEDDLRKERRARLVAKGAPQEYRDAEIFAVVESVLQRAVDGRDHDAVLLPELLGDEVEWRLQTQLRFSSHRPVIGPAIVFLKRRVLLPLSRWLYEYNLENFQRQQHVNRILFACVEELAIENAKLRALAGGRDGGKTEPKAE